VAQGDEGRYNPSLSDTLIDYDCVADVYDLYVTSDLDIAFYVAEAAKAQGKVLELMCGTGRVSVPLLEAGVDLTCVDASEGMLATPRGKTASATTRGAGVAGRRSVP
jgi:ubiquinone/menaquinone biosynthesis C-methylase UbiE